MKHSSISYNSSEVLRLTMTKSMRMKSNRSPCSVRASTASMAVSPSSASSMRLLANRASPSRMRRTIFRFRAESSYDTEEKDHTQTCYHYVNEPQLERKQGTLQLSMYPKYRVNYSMKTDADQVKGRRPCRRLSQDAQRNLMLTMSTFALNMCVWNTFSC